MAADRPSLPPTGRLAPEFAYRSITGSTRRPIIRARRDPRFACDLGLVANRLPDRERRIDEYFLSVAAELRERDFVLAGSGWGDKKMPSNVRYVGHLYTADHNAFNASALAVLNVSRDSMAAYGYSPATRVFEAAGAGACIITDAWEGIAMFFEPGREILVAKSGPEVAEHLARLTLSEAQRIGAAARDRALAEHTYARRVALVEQVLRGQVLTGQAP